MIDDSLLNHAQIVFSFGASGFCVWIQGREHDSGSTARESRKERYQFHFPTSRALHSHDRLRLGLLKRIFSFGKKEDENKAVVGTPTNFVHRHHIGFDPEKGFDVRCFSLFSTMCSVLTCVERLR